MENSFFYPLPDWEEIVNPIRRQKNKSSDLMNIPVFIYKILAPIISPTDSMLFNNSLSEGVAHATCIVLLTTLKNNDNCYLLFEQPSSGHFHATSCVSSYLWFPSHDLLARTKSTHCHFSARLEGTNASYSSSSYLHSWCAPQNLCFVTKSPVCRL